MTDLEMTKLCAEAMGYAILRQTKPLMPLLVAFKDEQDRGWTKEWMPLTDNADAMLLLKRFQLDVNWEGGSKAGHWFVRYWEEGREYGPVESDDLNRAIVECVAKMQSKAGELVSPPENT